MEIHAASSKSTPLKSTGGGEKAGMQERDLVMRYSHSNACNDEGGVRLFGVKLTDNMMSMRKSVSMGNLSSCSTISSQAVAQPSTPENIFESTGERLANSAAANPHGYVSDGLMLNSGSLRDRKKGVPWTEDEHRLFLVGLQKLGKGDWRGISRNFVSSRTPTQVASHAQKYFLRQMNLNKRKRRSSLFDIISSNMVTTSNSELAMEFNLTSSNLSTRHAAPIIPLEASSPVNSLASNLSSFSADLCLGRHPQEPHRLEHSQVLPPLSFASERWLSEGKILSSSTAVAAAFATMSSSSSSSSSSLSSLCSIDEATALSTDSLRLSIGPPHRLEPSELPLKLEQPVLKHSVSLSVANDSSKTLINAIRVV